jgi:hypothetical protein
MRKEIPAIFLLLTAMIIISAGSCTPQACFDETESFLKGTFYNSSAGKALAPDSVSLYGLGHASDLIYNKSTGIQPAQFPLDNSSDTSRFVIRINGTDDTLLFTYSSYPHLISRECGFTFYHTLDTFIYTTHNIDTIIRANKNITTANEENIRISY